MKTLRFFLVLFLLLVIDWFLVPVPYERFHGKSSVELIAVEGTPLRIFREESSGGWLEWKNLESFPKGLIRAILRAEDKRFYYHPGIDPIATARALYLDIKKRRIVSGGSTLSQQLARIVFSDMLPESKFLRKIVEIFLTLKLELQFSKNEILEAWLNRIPLRNNSLGVPAAARTLFGHDVSLLSEEENIALAVLPRQSQVKREKFEIRFRSLFRVLHPTQTLSEKKMEEVVSLIFPYTVVSNEADLFSYGYAPHFSEWFRKVAPGISGKIQTGITENLNRDIRDMIQNELSVLNGYDVSNAAVVVLEFQNKNSKGKELVLRSLVGSADFLNEAEGQVNGATAIRTAGSTLKPFIYARAMDQLGYTPYTIIHDTDISFPVGSEGVTYQPRNYDLNFWGDMTLREALATSRNIPAVSLLTETGLKEFYDILKNMNFSHLIDSPDHFGPGIALGTAGVSLLDLVHAYSIFPAGGELLPVVIGKDENNYKLEYGKDKKRFFTEETTIWISDILSDSDIRRKAFGFRSFLDFPFAVAAKTGTSKDYRDSWTVGYTSRYVVGVWVGNFSGKPMESVSGVFGAGRIFQQVMRRLNPDQRHHFKIPGTWRKMNICRLTGKRSGTYCPSQTEYIPPQIAIPEECNGKHDKKEKQNRDAVVTIYNPAKGEVYLLDPHLPQRIQEVPVSIVVNQSGNYFYSIDEMSKIRIYRKIEKTYSLKTGDHQLKIFQDNQLIDEIPFTVK